MAPDKAFPKPSKTSCSGEFGEFLLGNCINSLTLIAKGQDSPGAGGLASSAQY